MRSIRFACVLLREVTLLTDRCVRTDAVPCHVVDFSTTLIISRGPHRPHNLPILSGGQQLNCQGLLCREGRKPDGRALDPSRRRQVKTPHRRL